MATATFFTAAGVTTYLNPAAVIRPASDGGITANDLILLGGSVASLLDAWVLSYLVLCNCFFM